MDAPLTLYNARVCPFCHRVRLALGEKGLEVDIVEIDLDDKPAWLPKVSPEGKVPAIRHGDLRLWESAVINEYLEEVFPEPPLLPSTAPQRALARIWIGFAESRLVPSFYKLLLHQDAERQGHWRESFLTALWQMDEVLGETGGRYFMGPQLTLVDLVFYPWFERWPVLEHYRSLRFPEELSHLRRWVDNLADRETVRQEAQPADYYIEKYAKYASGTAQSGTAREMLES